jgi:hypothetical protein
MEGQLHVRIKNASSHSDLCISGRDLKIVYYETKLEDYKLKVTVLLLETFAL